MKFKLEIELGEECFTGAGQHAAKLFRLIRQAADLITGIPLERGDSLPIYDGGGKRVGKLEVQ